MGAIGVNHYPRHIGDIIAATQGLSLAERGAYDALLDQYYAHEKPLPLAVREVCRLANAATPSERKTVEFVLRRYFIEEPDGWHQKRCDAEIALYQGRIESARRAGQASARLRTGKPTPVEIPLNGRSDSVELTRTINQKPEPDGNGLALSLGSVSGPAASVGEGVQGEKTRRRASRLPTDWKLPEEWQIWAVEAHQLDAQRVVRISLKFRDFWLAKPGEGGTKLDWFATWRNWVRTELGDA